MVFVNIFIRFTPELMASTASSSLLTVFFEVMCLKMAFYLLLSGNSNSPALLDLTAYVSYKFVGYVVMFEYSLRSV